MDKKCAHCGQKSNPNILTCYPLCTSCYEQQRSQLDQFKASRAKTFPEIDQIIQNLYLGNQDAANNIQEIQKFNIQAILVCGSHLQISFENKIVYKKLDIADDPKQKIKNLFYDCYQWIQQNLNLNKNVLVHCAAGVSRSASFVIAYLMKKKQMKFQQAHQFVKQKRSKIFPNSGFLQQLREYQKLLNS